MQCLKNDVEPGHAIRHAIYMPFDYSAKRLSYASADRRQPMGVMNATAFPRTHYSGMPYVLRGLQVGEIANYEFGVFIKRLQRCLLTLAATTPGVRP